MTHHWTWEGYDQRRQQALGQQRPPPDSIDRALGADTNRAMRLKRAKESLRDDFKKRPWFRGVGISGNETEGWELRLMVAYDTPAVQRVIPAAVDGFPVVVTVRPGTAVPFNVQAVISTTPIERMLERGEERRRRAQEEFESDEFGVGVKGDPETYRMKKTAAQPPAGCTVHERTVCSCGAVIMQDRCIHRPGDKTNTTVKVRGCQACQKKQEGQPLLGFPGMWSAIVGRDLRPGAVSRALGRSTLGAFSAELQAQMRQAVIDGWQMVDPGGKPSLGAIQAIQAIGCHESSYGRGWGGQGVGSWNMGAYQCKCKPEGETCCDGCFLYQDSRPTENGQVKYMWCYKKYPSPAAGFADIIKLFKNNMKRVWAVLQCGNLDEIAWQMRESHYFEGFTTDHRKAAQAYAGALDKCAKQMATTLGETQAAARYGEQYGASGGCPPGMVGPDGAIVEEPANDVWVDDVFPIVAGVAAAAAIAWVVDPSLFTPLARLLG